MTNEDDLYASKTAVGLSDIRAVDYLPIAIGLSPDYHSKHSQANGSYVLGVLFHLTQLVVIHDTITVHGNIPQCVALLIFLGNHFY